MRTIGGGGTERLRGVPGPKQRRRDQKSGGRVKKERKSSGMIVRGLWSLKLVTGDGGKMSLRRGVVHFEACIKKLVVFKSKQ